MIKVDLITGFLGSGKTTFLKKYAEHLLNSGEKVGILENDYGAVNVDVMLLGELEKRGCQLETIAGACDYDCHKRRFKTKLIAMGMSELTRVIIEPSGIFDIEEFFDILHEDPLNRWYEAGSVITVIDPTVNIESSEFSRYLLASQTANAGAIIFSKTQLVTKEDIVKKTDQINLALKEFRSDREIRDEIITKPWAELCESDFESIKNSGYCLNETVKLSPDDSDYSSLCFMNTELSVKTAKDIIRKIFSDKSCGSVFRIKGFVKEGNWYELNAAPEQIEINPIELGQDIVIVIGENLNENNISSYFNNR
ncbi:MAG: GTPase (G3E family) [Ruminococcus sp.]|nr:GTPase (G3E family) [Ruminococcus sp.]